MIERSAGADKFDSIEEARLTNSNWEVIPVGEIWMQQFSEFESEAFRLEVLQAYAEPSEQEAFEDFRKGTPPDRSFIADWCDLVSQHKESGRSMSRVHLVDLPLSDYMKFEIEGAYKHTVKAGESIYLLDSSKISPQLMELLQEDFWLFDDTRVMVQDYSEEGRLLHSRLTSNPNLVAYYADIKEQVLRLAEPVGQFYKRLQTS